MLPKAKLIETSVTPTIDPRDDESLHKGTYRIVHTFEDKCTFDRATAAERNLFNDHVDPPVFYIAPSDQSIVGPLGGLVSYTSQKRCAEHRRNQSLLRRVFTCLTQQLGHNTTVATVQAILNRTQERVPVLNVFREQELRTKTTHEIYLELQSLVEVGRRVEAVDIDGTSPPRALRQAHPHLFAKIDALLETAERAHLHGNQTTVASMYQSISAICGMFGAVRVIAPPSNAKSICESATRLQSLPETVLDLARDAFGDAAVRRFLTTCRTSAGWLDGTSAWVKAIPHAFDTLLASGSVEENQSFFHDATALVMAEVTTAMHDETVEECMHRRFAVRARSDGDPVSSYQSLVARAANTHRAPRNGFHVANTPITWTVAIDFFLLGFLAFDQRIFKTASAQSGVSPASALEMHGVQTSPQQAFRDRVLGEAQLLFWRSDWLHKRMTTCSAAVSVVLAEDDFKVGRREEISRLTNAVSLAFFDAYFAKSFKAAVDLKSFCSLLSNAAVRFDAEKTNPLIDAIVVLQRLVPTQAPVEQLVVRVKEVLKTHSMRSGGSTSKTEDTISRVASKVFAGSFHGLVAQLGNPQFGHLGIASDVLPSRGLEPRQDWLTAQSTDKLSFATARLELVAGPKGPAPEVGAPVVSAATLAAREVVRMGRHGSPTRARLTQNVHEARAIKRHFVGMTSSKRGLASSQSPKRSPTRRLMREDLGEDKTFKNGEHVSADKDTPTVEDTVLAFV